MEVGPHADLMVLKSMFWWAACSLLVDGLKIARRCHLSEEAGSEASPEVLRCVIVQHQQHNLFHLAPQGHDRKGEEAEDLIPWKQTPDEDRRQTFGARKSTRPPCPQGASHSNMLPSWLRSGTLKGVVLLS